MTAANSLNKRLEQAARVWMLVKSGTPLEKAFAMGGVSFQNKAAVQGIVYGVMRKRALTAALTRKLVTRTPSPEVEAVIQLGLSEILDSKRSEFTVVNEAVSAVKAMERNPRIGGFVNAVLRRFCREKARLMKSVESYEDVKFNAPNWWIKRYKKALGEAAESVFAVQAKHPPMSLRVNRRKTIPQQYLEALKEAGIEARLLGEDGILLAEPVAVGELPGFEEGMASVQDAGSQLAARILEPADGMNILDACAAPGGKTMHIFELVDARLTALEIDKDRAAKIQENFDRLGVKCSIKVTDASDVDNWWDGEKFDRILLDAPCTASGIVRRHPDIPWSRREEDIRSLASTQHKLLEALWPLVKNGGRMLYAVCSVFPDEGVKQIERFTADHPEAALIPFVGAPEGMLRLIPSDQEDHDGLPGTHDGFFYALLEKRRETK